MPGATYVVSSFLGGELSKKAEGRFEKPDYKMSLRTCRNGLPVEAGAWMRRPPTMDAGTTLNGAPGRVIEFDVAQASAFTCEYTDGNLRFRSGPNIVGGTLATPYTGGIWKNNRVVQAETVQILLNPAVAPQALVAGAVNAFTLNPATFNDGPYLDPFTNGVQATPSAPSGVIGLTLAFPQWNPTLAYANGAFVTSGGINYESTADQNEGTAIGITTSSSSASIVATNSFVAGNPVEFFVSGGALNSALTAGSVYYVIATGLSGAHFQVSATLGGSAITMTGAGTGTQTVALAPAGLANWTAISAAAAINGGKGFLGTDIGRLVRLFSEPPAWSSASTYAASTATTPIIVSYNPSGQPGATTYWQSLQSSNTNHPPGADLTNWQIIPQGAAIWTWGKIVSLTNIISPSLSGSASVGDMTGGGGLNAAFNGVFAQAAAASAEKATSGSGFWLPGQTFTLSSFVGKNYSGAAAQQIQQVTIYPSSDEGFAFGSYFRGGITTQFAPTVTFNLRGKSTAPGSATDGTLLGTSGPIANSLTAVTIVSSDQSTSWNYVWVEQETVTDAVGPTGANTYMLTNAVGQLSLFNPPGSGTSSGVNVEILGPALLYTNPVVTWRLGVYSNTTGWPTCGVYNDGRLYLGGAVGNRFDACYSNGVVGGTVNFAPTDQYGAVTAAHAISYTFNSKGVNPIFWMKPDLQGIKAGTQAGEWLIQAPTAGSISPLNVTARNVTNHGSANIEPVDTEHTLVFVQRFGRKLPEFFPDVFSGKFSAQNLSDKAEQFTKAGVAELAYTSAVTPIIWGRCNDGSWFGITYKRDSLASSQPATFYGWHGHTLGSGRVVESICAGASVGGDLDALTIVTNDLTTGIRRVEILTDTPDEDTPLSEEWYLDGAVLPTLTAGTSSAVLSGLPWADGTVVQVFCAGIDCGDLGDEKGAVFPTDFTVAGGAITVTYGDGISAGPGRGLFTETAALAASGAGQLVVGFVYNSDGEIVKPLMPQDSGSRSGPAFGLIQRIHRASFGLIGSLGFQIGNTFAKLQNTNFKQADDTRAYPSATAYTGLHYETMPSDYTRDSTVCWRASRVGPLTITQFAANLQSQDQ